MSIPISQFTPPPTPPPWYPCLFPTSVSLFLLCMERFFLTSTFRFYENVFPFDFASRSGIPLFFLCQNAVVTHAGCYLLLWFQLWCELPVATGFVDIGTVSSDVLEDIMLEGLWVLLLELSSKWRWLSASEWQLNDQLGKKALNGQGQLWLWFSEFLVDLSLVLKITLLSVLSEPSSRSSTKLCNDICVNRSWAGWWPFWSAGSYRGHLVSPFHSRRLCMSFL